MHPPNIPKVIHYCWFGGAPLPELAARCIESWKKYCPDYEIKRWDESNFDVDCCDYTREAYAAKKWAFVSDVARLHALVNYGGIYMDTDMEVLKPLDGFLRCRAFSGFESDAQVSAGIMAGGKNQELFEEMLREYAEIHFFKPDGTCDCTTIVARFAKVFAEYGFISNNQLQTVRGFTVFPKEYFYPKDCNTLEICMTENTHTIHHFSGSWAEPLDEYHSRLRRKMLKLKIIPYGAATHIARYISYIKFKGIAGANQEMIEWMRRRRQDKE